MPCRINGGAPHPLRTWRPSVSNRRFTAATRNRDKSCYGPLCVAGRHAGLPLPDGWTGRHGESVVTREAVPANGVQHVIARFLAPSLTLPRDNNHRGGNSHVAVSQCLRALLSLGQGFQCLALTTFECTVVYGRVTVYDNIFQFLALTTFACTPLPCRLDT